MEQAVILKDPFGLQVTIKDSLCFVDDPGERDSRLLNDFRTVIERPAFVIDMRAGNPPSRYYFRSIGWDTSLLIRAEWRDGSWLAKDCQRNPEELHLKNLAEQGKVISGPVGGL
jgi:hypothetical protein